MPTFKHFEEIIAWQLARELSIEVHRIATETRLARDFKLRDQICDSSESIGSNIAEGFGRSGNAEFVHFLLIARASCTETQSHLYAVLDRQYINQAEFARINHLAERTGKAIFKLIDYLQNSGIKGVRFRKR
ncbi:MAG: four helix bundle protein [Chitinophagaceae bacterium]|nr:MAG: four helix bundle protein [Chitinophagaceae bacterium]